MPSVASGGPSGLLVARLKSVCHPLVGAMHDGMDGTLSQGAYPLLLEQAFADETERTSKPAWITVAAR